MNANDTSLRLCAYQMRFFFSVCVCVCVRARAQAVLHHIIALWSGLYAIIAYTRPRLNTWPWAGRPQTVADCEDSNMILRVVSGWVKGGVERRKNEGEMDW